MLQPVSILKELIRIPSISREEEKSADFLEIFFKGNNWTVTRIGNNVIVRNKYFNPGLPSILLNSHHDTIKPSPGWTLDPFMPKESGGKLYGLGSNDAGGSVVSLIQTFSHFHDEKDLNYNLILVISAEEEVSGKNGVESVLPALGDISFGIIGEPTGMQMAIAEKGLMVLDCTVHGVAGHAAREEGENAIYKSLKDIQWFQDYRFKKVSDKLGMVKMTVSVIKGGTQHNMVPDLCEFVVDVRSTDVYSNEEIIEVIKENVSCEVIPRSTRLQSSFINPEHVIVKAGSAIGLESFGSSTLSDQTLMPFPTVKLGPGKSARSHTADEYIYTDEIQEAVEIYTSLLKKVLTPNT